MTSIIHSYQKWERACVRVCKNHTVYKWIKNGVRQTMLLQLVQVPLSSSFHFLNQSCILIVDFKPDILCSEPLNLV